MFNSNNIICVWDLLICNILTKRFYFSGDCLTTGIVGLEVNRFVRQVFW